MSLDLFRGSAVGATVFGYAALCAGIWWRERQRSASDRAAARALAGDGTAAPTLVLFASQTGQAEALAWQTAQGLHANGEAVQVQALNAIDTQALRAAPRVLFIASTYGEGDAPDGASLFVEKEMDADTALAPLRYAVLALGDSQYAQFCGFGRRLDRWLSTQGATPLFDRIEVDNGDTAALTQWRSALGLDSPPDSSDAAAAFAPWQLAARERLNPGSAGAPLHRLVLQPPPGLQPDWASGDLVQIAPPAAPERPRDYSIASIPIDGALELLVREERHPDGTLGCASGWLTQQLQPGETVPLRIQPHRSFRLNGNADRPLILIGNGSGLAGLSSHLRARAAAGQGDNWLLFGERNATHDWLCRDEIHAWQAAGLLRRVDRVFSRDGSTPRYVQEQLSASADEVRAWIDRGAAIYVCGSLQGMAGGVDAALRALAGPARYEALLREARYCRDVY